MEPIVTKRLTIRELEESDAMFLHELGRDPRISKYIGKAKLDREPDAYRIWIKKMKTESGNPEHQKGFAIEHRKKRLFIGYLTLGIEQQHAAGKLGWIVKSDFWGKGFAKESATALVDYCFAKLRMHRIWMNCRPQNKPSTYIAEVLGMTYEGHFREHLWVDGKWEDSLYYSVLVHEWGNPNIREMNGSVAKNI